MVEVYSSVLATKKQISSELVGGAVILDRKSGVYYGLNSVGASIWNLVHQPKTVNETRDSLLTAYFVESSQCEHNLLPLFQALKSNGSLRGSMKRLHKFLSLTPSDRVLLINALLLLGAIRLGLKLLPLQTLRRLLARIAQPIRTLQEADKASVDKVAWAVMVASHYIPGARCLVQALATQVLLERRGYPTQLRIGFTRGKGGQMSAHAWVESEGRVAIGGTGSMAHYIVLPIQGEEGCEPNRWHLFS